MCEFKAIAVLCFLANVVVGGDILGSNFLAGGGGVQDNSQNSLSAVSGGSNGLGFGLTNSPANIGISPFQSAANILNFSPTSLFGILNSQFSLSSGTSVGLGTVLQSVANGNITPEIASLECVSQSVVSTTIIRQFSSITSNSLTSIFGRIFSQSQITNVLKFQQTWISLVRFQSMLQTQMNVALSLQQCATQLLQHAPQQVAHGVSQIGSTVVQAGSGVAQLGVTVIGMPVRLASVCIDACASVVQKQMSMEQAVLTFITSTSVSDSQVNSILAISQLSSSQSAFIPGGMSTFQQFQSTLLKVKSVQTTIVNQFGSQVSILSVAQQLLRMTTVVGGVGSVGGALPLPVVEPTLRPPTGGLFTGPQCATCNNNINGQWIILQDTVFNTPVAATISTSSSSSLQVTFSIVNTFNFVWTHSSNGAWIAQLVSQTKMAGPPAVMQFESFFVAAMLGVTEIDISSTQVKFVSSSGTACFVRPSTFPTLEPFATTAIAVSPIGNFVASSSSLGIDLTLTIAQQNNTFSAIVRLVNSFFIQLVATSSISTFNVQLISSTRIGVTDNVAVTETSLSEFLSKGCVLEVSTSGVSLVNGQTRIAFTKSS